MNIEANFDGSKKFPLEGLDPKRVAGEGREPGYYTLKDPQNAAVVGYLEVKEGSDPLLVTVDDHDRRWETYNDVDRSVLATPGLIILNDTMRRDT